MPESKQIGQILEEAGYINEEQIKVALTVQEAHPMFFGETLQNLDFVTSNEIAEAIAKQAGLEYINLDNIVPTEEALSLVPYELAKTKTILPIEIENDDLIIATQNINDLATIDFLKKTTKRNIKLVVGDQNSISRYIEVFYYQLTNPIEMKIKDIIKKSLNSEKVDIIELVDLIISNASKDKSTDVHITPEEFTTNIFYRIDGVMHHYFSIPGDLHAKIISRIKVISKLDISELRKPQDGSFTYTFLKEEIDLRVSTIPTNFGENVVLRLLSKGSSLFSLSKLGLSEKNEKKVEKYFAKPYGVILVVGPTGSGKTTTLYSALRKINSLKKNVTTIEDPIEYKFSFIKQTELNEKAGYTFNTAIKSFMRQDPDVILVGEIRDSETAELAIRASITGHLVLSTLHTNNASGTIPRLQDLGIPSYLIGSGLIAVIAQRLVRKLCIHCSVDSTIKIEELRDLGFSEDILKDRGIEVDVKEPKGCVHCNNTGYSGREIVVEILEIDTDIETMIDEGKNTVEILKVAKKNGMTTMKDDGFEKILIGKTSVEEVIRTLG